MAVKFPLTELEGREIELEYTVDSLNEHFLLHT